MHQDVSPEIKVNWLSEEERKITDHILLLEGNMVSGLLRLNYMDDLDLWRSETTREVNDIFFPMDGDPPGAGEQAIKNLIGLGILQYQEDSPLPDRDKTIIEDFGKQGDNLHFEVSVPVNVGCHNEKLVRMRVSGNTSELKEIEGKINQNRYELSMMPDKITNISGLPERHGLVETLKSQLRWDDSSLNSFVSSIDFLLKIQKKGTLGVNPFVHDIKGKIRQWQNNTKLGMDSGSIGRVLSLLEAEGILTETISFSKGRVETEDENDHEVAAEVDKTKFKIKIKFNLGEDSRDMGTVVELEVGGKFNDLKKIKRRYLEQIYEIHNIISRIDEGTIGPGKIIQTAKNYDLIDEHGKEIY